MKKDSFSNFICPITKEQLFLKEEKLDKYGDVISGILFSRSKKEYSISDGIPDFFSLSGEEKNNYAINLFKEKASIYDNYQHLSFETFYQEENNVRNYMINKLELKGNEKVLELNAGTGRDSVLISERLNSNGELHVQDISRDMLLQLRNKKFNMPPIITRSDACLLPYKDSTFNAIYSFAGVGMETYASGYKVFDEITRVAKNGARVVIGGLSLAPWLKNTEFGRILINHNPHYGNVVDLSCIPIKAKNLNLSYIMSGTAFIIDFTVDSNAIQANFDYEIPGIRGGTHNTRYYGRLEGVTPSTKELAWKAIRSIFEKDKTISMHKWLDHIVKREAKKLLENSNEVD